MVFCQRIDYYLGNSNYTLNYHFYPARLYIVEKLDEMEISQSNTRLQFPLSTKKPFKKTVASSFAAFFFILFFILFGATFITQTLGFNITVGSSVILGGILLFAIITVFDYWLQVMYFKTYYYDFTEHFIIIRKGVISINEITIPYERVQDIYVDQDILDRMFGLYDVHLSSATLTSGFEAHIDGLEQQAADGLKEVLLDVVGKKVATNQYVLAPVPPLLQPSNTTPLP